MSAGWIKLPRKVLNQDVAVDDELLGLYVRVMASVNYKPGRFKSSKLSTFVDVLPGQLIFGWRTITKKLYKHEEKRPSPNTIRRRIQTLQNLGLLRIETHSSKQFSILTLAETPVAKPATRSGTGSGTRSGTDIRREKKECKKRKIKPPTLEEVQQYCRERNSPVDARRFWEYFDAGGWHDSLGKPVKAWKQKLITWESRNNQPEQATESELPRI